MKYYKINKKKEHVIFLTNIMNNFILTILKYNHCSLIHKLNKNTYVSSFRNVFNNQTPNYTINYSTYYRQWTCQ